MSAFVREFLEMLGLLGFLGLVLVTLIGPTLVAYGLGWGPAPMIAGLFVGIAAGSALISAFVRFASRPDPS